MTNELFTTLGIDLSQPPERVREALEEKNLEYLERLDACADEARADQLRAVQADIEAAIQGLADGTLTLPKPAPDATPAPTPQTAQTAAKVDPQTQAALEEGAKRITAQDLPGALEVLKPLADQGDGQGCILTAQVYKLQGDDTNYRRYLFNAAKGGSGDGALLLAQDYFAKGETDQAKKWAEKAHELQAPGAGQLLLRLLGSEEKYGEALRLAAEEIQWLPDFELFALCTDLKKLLEGGAVADDTLVRMVGPMVRSLSKKPTAQKLLDEPYQAAMDRERKRAAKEEQERKAKELEAQEARAQRDREEAERQKKQAQLEAEAKKRKVVERNKKTIWIWWLILPPIFAVVIRMIFGPFSAIAGQENLIVKKLVYAFISIGVAAQICGMTNWALSDGKNRTVYSPVVEFLLMAVVSFLGSVAFFILLPIVFSKFFGENWLRTMSIHLGSLHLTGDDFFGIETYCLCLLTSIVGAKHVR